jgi:hypothetical protein
MSISQIEEDDRDRVEDLLRAIVRFKNGGREINTTGNTLFSGPSGSQHHRTLVRSSNIVDTGPRGLGTSPDGSSRGTGGQVPRPRTRGYFSGVALGGIDSRAPVDRNRSRSRSRMSETRAIKREVASTGGVDGTRANMGQQRTYSGGTRSISESSEEEEEEEDADTDEAHEESGQSSSSRPSTSRVSEFGASIGEQGGTQTVTELGMRMGRMDVNGRGEDTVKPVR